MLWNVPRAHLQYFRPLPWGRGDTLGTGGGVPFRGCQVRLCGLPTAKNSFLPYWTPGPEVPWGQEPATKWFAQHGTQNMCPVNTHWWREGPAALPHAYWEHASKTGSLQTETKKHGRVHKGYFQGKKKVASDRIQENWHIWLPFEESNTENMSNKKRKSGRIWLGFLSR